MAAMAVNKLLLISDDNRPKTTNVTTVTAAKRWQDDPNNWQTFRLTRRVPRLHSSSSGVAAVSPPIAKLTHNERLLTCFGDESFLYQADGLEWTFDECTRLKKRVEVHSLTTRDRHLRLRMVRLISSSSDDFFTSDDFIVDAPLRVFYPTIHPDDMLQ